MIACLPALSAALLLTGAPAPTPAPPPSAASAAEPNGSAGGVIRRGAPLSGAPAQPLAKVTAAPATWAGKAVTVKGAVRQACTRKGCWMELTDGPSQVRVTFKDYAFFVPLDAAGSRATVEGEVQVKRLSKEKADHYAGEGGTIRRNPDGSADEVTLIASGVELVRSPAPAAPAR